MGLGVGAPNPVVELAHVIASLRDTEGRIRVAEYYEDVRPLTEMEKSAAAESPEVEDALRKELGLGRSEGGSERLAERILLPALNLRGIAGGDIGDQATNSIPTEATASIDLRLVPDQTPAKVRSRIEEHFKREASS